MISVALLGFGVVGSGCAEVLTANKEKIEAHIGQKINIKYILDLREFPDSPFGHLVVHDFNTILNDPEVSVVAEMMGGSHPAYDFTKALLGAGKSVVTSNKEVVSTFGVELLSIAAENNARYLFEASVGGGIPIIRPLTNDLAANEILSIDGILNGTTNFILTKMRNEGSDFAEVLAEAQRLGYAEANPSADVDGVDAARKISILAALASGKLVDPKKVATEGIREVTPADMETARKLACTIKLIGHYETDENGKIAVSVAPRFVPIASPLSTIDDVFNGILVRGNMLGDSLFYGRGAGKLPTASAVCADIIDAAFTNASHAKKLIWAAADDNDIADISAVKVKRCIITSDEAFITSDPITLDEAKKYDGYIKSYEIL
jgi:homoserine dehydrogenase